MMHLGKMNFEEKAKLNAEEASKKMALIKKWPSRLKKLNERAKNPMKESEFCRKYEISNSRFNRLKNKSEISVPTDIFMQKIEKAFEAEKV